MTDSEGNTIISMNKSRETSFIYFNYESTFNVKIGGNEVTLSELTQSQQRGPGDKDNDDDDDDDDDNDNIGSFLEIKKNVMLFGVIFL